MQIEDEISGSINTSGSFRLFFFLSLEVSKSLHFAILGLISETFDTSLVMAYGPDTLKSLCAHKVYFDWWVHVKLSAAYLLQIFIYYFFY